MRRTSKRNSDASVFRNRIIGYFASFCDQQFSPEYTTQQLYFLGAEKDTNTCLTRMTFGFLSPNSKIILISNHGVRMYNQLVILQFLLGKQYFYLVNHLAEAW